ncbi:MAG: TetR/AcrR family transcriptional regulator [Bacillota bacterium]|nr:TetR/AcrR family transcriptional regulator [Bacillota bacterium]
MNRKFYSLSQEKQQRIINSGMEVFAKNSYNKASTQEIAAKAGISKGLLFHYFHNKREFYNFLYKYGEEKLRRSLSDMSPEEETDFFVIMEKAAKIRLRFVKENPWLTQFALKACYSKNEAISEDINKAMSLSLDGAMNMYFRNIDKHKFKEDIEPERVLNALIWLSDGYIQERERKGQSLNTDDLIAEFQFWCRILRASVYKEEFNGNN